MSNHRRSIALVAGVLAISAAVLFAVFKDTISEKLFFRTGRELEQKLSPKLREKYSSDLQHTLRTFWKFYERGLLSKNDLNDVMDKMKRLIEKKEISDRDIFDFIGYVSRLYTDAINRARSESYPE